MDTHVEHLRKTYECMDVDELLNRAKSNTLTEAAHAVALNELKSREVDTAELPEKPSPLPADKETPSGFFWRCWHGKEKLWKAYWLLGLLVGLVFGTIRISSGALIQTVLFLLVALPIQVFWWVSVWRCAFRSSHWSWAILARGAVILGVVIPCLIILSALT